MYSGDLLKLRRIDENSGLVVLDLCKQGSSVNSIGSAFLQELESVCELLEADDTVRGLLITSSKSTFVVGADIFEFPPLFNKSAADFSDWAEKSHALFNRVENLPFPSVAAINGLALGGGLELALLADARVIAQSARIGLPEVTLGLCPGWGGTVRASRLAGPMAALEMMLSGKPVSSAKAVELGLATRCVADAELADAALDLLKQMANAEVDHRQLRAGKQNAVPDAKIDEQAFSAYLKADYPAAGAILKLVMHHAPLSFDQALAAERDCFITLGQTDCAKSLVGLFINDQRVKQVGKQAAKAAQPVEKIAVLGAGIMGGGIAYQAAVTGTPVILKDIRQEALELGIDTATKALDKQVAKGKMDESAKKDCLSLIEPTLEFGGFDAVGLVVEAVVENEKIKHAVLTETEAKLAPDAILTSNTSTISITTLAQGLQRPQNFCGMHFFNPVPMMPLVEVIRGEKSSETAVATAVDCALKMGKTPIVVNDCPGFLVNRVLFPYFNAFNRLLHDGVDFQRIDRVMEAFGWPMGPAYLADVVGLDTMVHADEVLQAGYPERMGHDHKPIIEELLEQGALGQKNGHGFYDYGNGPRNKVASQQALDLIAERVEKQIEISDQQIIDRMMIPMCLEAYLCLDEGIVGSAAEIDMGLIMGIGFPKFRGGALRYIDHQGHDEFAARVDALSTLGSLYVLPESFRQRSLSGQSFF
ncbi:fatty acid oxidation complex subunit alpha FadB [Marinobacterium sp. D7]|uniref:fatty acid oxidation complex subunit alpha FadB n=1 Tax=Marinobacterium ramblicola TaxID=2849041 RepID=UPI001C2DCF7D|nr:fatty acid oxidation complex subunit alpha FadB [Marinobacterium ramblicola]MBV1790695.1 fatty acid oxidation complex subunit alpha FadB [Marinobacterium ramblicola]